MRLAQGKRTHDGQRVDYVIDWEFIKAAATGDEYKCLRKVFGTFLVMDLFSLCRYRHSLIGTSHKGV